MKRRVIKQGRNTLTITLPSKWAQDFNIKAGDELDLVERGNTLFVGVERKSEELKTEIDISGMEIPMLWRHFMGFYREGYDEIKVKFNPDELYDSPFKFFVSHAMDRKYVKEGKMRRPIEAIQKMMGRFIGFEIIEQHKDHCVIKDMGEISSKEFEASLRRVFLLIQQMAEDVNEAMKTKDHKMLEQTHDIDINVDKFHDYCIRVLNKTGFKDVKKSHIMFAILYLLEMLGDEYKDISFHIFTDVKTEKVDPCILKLGELVKAMFDNIYSLYYTYSKEKSFELSKQDHEIFFYMPEVYKRAIKNQKLSLAELEIANHFKRIVRYINALVELIVEREY